MPRSETKIDTGQARLILGGISYQRMEQLRRSGRLVPVPLDPDNPEATTRLYYLREDVRRLARQLERAQGTGGRPRLDGRPVRRRAATGAAQ